MECVARITGDLSRNPRTYVPAPESAPESAPAPESAAPESGTDKGPADLKLLMDTELDGLTTVFEADVVVPVQLCQRAIPLMTA
jgi:hypothetical protein